jgi:hypothetical protein
MAKSGNPFVDRALPPVKRGTGSFVGLNPIVKPVADRDKVSGGGLNDAINRIAGGAKPKPKPKPKPVQGPPVPKRPSGVGSRPSATRPANRVSGGSGGTSAPRPSTPKTFTDGKGVVRPVGGGKTRTVKRSTKRTKTGPAAPAAKDPITQMVDEIIAGMNKPIEAQKAAVDAQARGNQDQNHRLANTYDQRLTDLRATGNLDMGAALNRAAELKGISADTIAKNQEWLMSLMGPDGGGGGMQMAQADAKDTQSIAGAANDRLAQEMAGGGQRLNDFLVSAQAGGRGMEREFDYQDQLRARALKQEKDNEIAANEGQRAKMSYEIRSNAEENRLKEMAVASAADMDLAKLQAQIRDGDLDRASRETIAQAGDMTTLEAARMRAANGKKGAKAPAPGKYGNIPKRYDTAIDSVWRDLNSRQNDPKKGLQAPWRTAHQALVDHGLNPNTAAFLASKWYGDSVSAKKSTPAKVLAMLRGRGVSDAAAKNIITRGFGASGWKIAQAGGGVADQISDPVNNIVAGNL